MSHKHLTKITFLDCPISTSARHRMETQKVAMYKVCHITVPFPQTFFHLSHPIKRSLHTTDHIPTVDDKISDQSNLFVDDIQGMAGKMAIICKSRRKPCGVKKQKLISDVYMHFLLSPQVFQVFRI